MRPVYNLANYQQWRQFHIIEGFLRYHPYDTDNFIIREFGKSKITNTNQLLVNEIQFAINPFSEFSTNYAHMSELEFFHEMYDTKEKRWTGAAVALGLKIRSFEKLYETVRNQVKSDIFRNTRNPRVPKYIIRNPEINKVKMAWLDAMKNIYIKYSEIFNKNKYIQKVVINDEFSLENKKLLNLQSNIRALFSGNERAYTRVVSRY